MSFIMHHCRTADTIVSWLEKKTGPPALALASVEEATAFVSGECKVVLDVEDVAIDDVGHTALALASVEEATAFVSGKFCQF